MDSEEKYSPESKNKEMPKEELKMEGVEKAVSIHDDFRVMIKKNDPSKDKELANEFEQVITNIGTEFKMELERNNSPSAKTISILKARNKVLDLTFEKMIALIPDKDAFDIWKKIQKENNTIIKELLEIASKPPRSNSKDSQRCLNEAKEQFESEKKELLDQITSLESENKKYLDTIIKRSKMTGTVTGPVTKKVQAKTIPKPKRIVNIIIKI